MTWRSLYIRNPASLSLRHHQLQIDQQGESILVPLEDIGVLLIESPQVHLTSRLLAACGEKKVPILFCDLHHLPCAVLHSFHSHSRQRKIMVAQIEATAPFRKNCWQKIVIQKIINQADCLRLSGQKDYTEIRALAEKVLSGDTSGREAHAAQLYFPRLFPGSGRRQDTVQNSALNYGYAILRGLLAQALTIYGLIPALGLHHASELNPFNLADDLLEPFRPMVDLWVLAHASEATEFTPQIKQGLVGLLHRPILIQGKRQTLLRALDLSAAQVASAYLAKDPRKILLPHLLPLEVDQDG